MVLNPGYFYENYFMKNLSFIIILSLLIFSCQKDPSIPATVSAKVKYLIFTSISANITKVDTFSYQYDSLDRLIMEKSALQNSTSVYSYIGNGKCIQSNFINGIEGLNIMYIANNTSLIDSTLVISTDKKDTVYTKWLYNVKNLVSQVKHYNRKKELWKVDYFTYDSNSNVSYIEEKDANDQVLQIRAFEVSSEKPFWYNYQQALIPSFFVNTPIKQTTNNNEISTINYTLDEYNRIVKETWNNAINNNITIKEFVYF
jgi:hypothetical protein